MSLAAGLEIVIATYNPGKIREVEEALRALPLKLRFVSEFPNVATIDEVGKTYEENAVLKALGYAKQTGQTALADDSGLEVDLLGGKPGIFSARFGGEGSTDSDRVQLLLQQLSKHESKQRRARFVCCMALAGWDASDKVRTQQPQLLTVILARCEGAISLAPRGSNGFGFDPVFIPAGFESTFGELPTEIKAEISHRAQALAAIRVFLLRSMGQA